MTGDCFEQSLTKRIRIDYDQNDALSDVEVQAKNEAKSPEDLDESLIPFNSESKKVKKKKKTKDWFKKVTPHVTSAELPLDLFNDEEEEEEEEEDVEEEAEEEENPMIKPEKMKMEDPCVNLVKEEMEIKKEPLDDDFADESTPVFQELSTKTTGHISSCYSDPSIVPISEYEEEKVLKQLENSPNLLSKNLFARQLRRKLKVRRLQRERGLPVFNLDQSILRIAKENNLVDESIKKEEIDTMESIRVLDRYLAHPHINSGRSDYHCSTFKMKLVGRDEYSKTIKSPFTGRMLKPYIRRDYESRPLKLRLLNEILRRGKKNIEPHPIDYCYVQPHHIPAINSLVEKFFWPGIDLSECLQYPDFSCVVLYRRIVIAFAFLVPDVSHTEAYISFIFTHPEWRRAGIGKFMLYHLIQTCMGKDIILHVSANNPAILLYQKFGFKVEEHVVDFYDKYLPSNSNECKHALFLRLSRY